VKRAKENVRVRSFLADGAYDSRDNFTFLSDSNIKPVIRVRSSSAANSRGCLSRKHVVIEQRYSNPRLGA